MGSIFLNDSINKLLSGGSSAQQAYAALELRHEWHGVPDEVPSLDSSISHLPTCKFPDELKEKQLLSCILSSSSHTKTLI